jgi:hypothetical protein
MNAKVFLLLHMHNKSRRRRKQPSHSAVQGCHVANIALRRVVTCGHMKNADAASLFAS